MILVHTIITGYVHTIRTYVQLSTGRYYIICKSPTADSQVPGYMRQSLNQMQMYDILEAYHMA
eukprot:SAG11_NODE_695_length_7694_cov_5.002502_4_plen_63_part_00